MNVDYQVTYTITITDIEPYNYAITEEEKREIINVVKIKIGQVPKVEEMRIEAKNQELLAKEKAFKEAKKRFRSLSVFQKVKLNLRGHGPEQLHRSLDTIEEINSLYRK